MEGKVTITGKVVSGAGKAADFTGLDWVESQCMAKLGFRPFPGTLNLELSPQGVRSLSVLEERAGMKLVPPDPSFCSASIVPISLGASKGALVILPEEVRVHPKNIVEVIAPVKLRDTLGLRDGSEVTMVSSECAEPVQLRVGGRLLPIRAAIFDLDGTLIDTREIYYTIMERVFDRAGFPRATKKLLVEAAANGEFDWEMVLPSEAKGRVGELRPVLSGIIREISPALFEERNSLIPGVDSLLRRLSSAGVRLGVATSTERRVMKLKIRPIRDSGLESLFQAIVTADDVTRQKPAPDPLLECAKRLGIPPGECLYCGDMRLDIKAGKAAGMITAAVLTGFDSHSVLEAEGPDLILGSVVELEFARGDLGGGPLGEPIPIA